MLVDSISPWDRRGRGRRRWCRGGDDAAGESTKTGCGSAAPGDPLSRALGCTLTENTCAGPLSTGRRGKAGVGLAIQASLASGSVRSSGFFTARSGRLSGEPLVTRRGGDLGGAARPRLGSVRANAERRSRPAPLGVERLGGPRDDVEGVSAADRVRAAFGTTSAIQSAASADTCVKRAPVDAEGVEEAPQSGLVPTRGGPHQPAGVVVDDDSQVQWCACRRSRRCRSGAGRRTGRRSSRRRPRPGHDRADGAPGDPHQLAHSGFRARHRQPRHGVVEDEGVPGVVPRPRHRDHRRAVGGALDPRRVGLQLHPHRAQIQRPPPAPARTAIVARRVPPAPTAAAPRTPPRPHMRDHHLTIRAILNELDRSITARLSTPSSARHKLNCARSFSP